MKQDLGLISLIDELRKLPTETEWVEFKANYDFPEKIGEYISALSNSACLHQKDEAYLVFGIENNTHKIIGTNFNYMKERGKGSEPLESWLARSLNPTINFKIEELAHPMGRLVIFFIPPTNFTPIKFLDRAYIRIGSTTKLLSNFPDKEAIIWDRRIPFEDRIAKEDVSETNILELLNHDQYFRLTGERRPQKDDSIIDKLLQEEFILRKKGRFHISNLGAILLAENLDDFPTLSSKKVRVITYKGINRLTAIKDVSGKKGYGVGFENLIDYIQSQIPEPEIIITLRSKTIKYPVKSIREFVANSLVHQDFSVMGQSPLIEIFEDRMEISNPGNALIEPNRFMDHPPKSRNEKLADKLRRMKICEKRGSGIDRAVFEIEMAQLPAPKIENLEKSVKVIMHSNKSLKQLTKEDKCRMCYFHSCVKHILDQDFLTNSSLCKRAGIEKKNQAIASRIISDTLNKGLIRPFDQENKSNRYAKYLPYWA